MVVWFLGIIEHIFRARNKLVSDLGPLGSLALIIDFVLLLCFGAFAYTLLYLHPTANVAEALAYLCLFYIGCRLAVSICEWEEAHTPRFAMISVTTLVVGVGVVAGTWPYLRPNLTGSLNADRWSIANLFQQNDPKTFFFSDRLEGHLVRSLDNFLNRFANRYTVIESPGSYWMFPLLIFPIRYTGNLFFVGHGIPHWARFLPTEPELEPTHVRRYHFVNEWSIVSVSDNCELQQRSPAIYDGRVASVIESCSRLYSPLGTKFFNAAQSRLNVGDEAYIYPLPISQPDQAGIGISPGDAMYADVTRGVTWRPASETQSVRELLAVSSRTGIREEIYNANGLSVGWSIVSAPIQRVQSALIPLASPLSNGEYRSYLLRMDGTFYRVYALIFVQAADTGGSIPRGPTQ